MLSLEMIIISWTLQQKSSCFTLKRTPSCSRLETIITIIISIILINMFMVIIRIIITLKRTPSCSRLETGGKVNRGISSLSNIHWYRLQVQPHFGPEGGMMEPTRAAHCRHILNRICKFGQGQGYPVVGEDRAASAGSPPVAQTMTSGAHRPHQDQKPRPAPF